MLGKTEIVWKFISMTSKKHEKERVSRASLEYILAVTKSPYKNGQATSIHLIYLNKLTQHQDIQVMIHVTSCF